MVVIHTVKMQLCIRSAKKLQAALEKLVGTVNNISENPELPMFAVEKYKAEFEDSEQPDKIFQTAIFSRTSAVTIVSR